MVWRYVRIEILYILAKIILILLITTTTTTIINILLLFLSVSFRLSILTLSLVYRLTILGPLTTNYYRVWLRYMWFNIYKPLTHLRVNFWNENSVSMIERQTLKINKPFSNHLYTKVNLLYTGRQIFRKIHLPVMSKHLSWVANFKHSKRCLINSCNSQ